jgi:hypothetical protein
VPLKETHLINFKADQIEMLAELEADPRDDLQILRTQIADRLFEHQLELMTDPALIDPVELAVSSAIVSRDAVDATIEAVLTEFGLLMVTDQDRDIRPNKPRMPFSSRRRNRTQLRKWSKTYLRAQDMSDKLAQLECKLYEINHDDGHFDSNRHLRLALEETLGVTVEPPSIESLVQLETAILSSAKNRGQAWVLLASSVRSITSFVGESIRQHAPESRWGENHEEAQILFVQSERGQIVRSDPGLRVVRFITQGSKALLSDYAKKVIRQSLTPSD